MAKFKVGEKFKALKSSQRGRIGFVDRVITSLRDETRYKATFIYANKEPYTMVFFESDMESVDYLNETINSNPPFVTFIWLQNERRNKYISVIYDEPVKVWDEIDKKYRFLIPKKLINQPGFLAEGKNVKIRGYLTRKYKRYLTDPSELNWVKAEGFATIDIDGVPVSDLVIHWFQYPNPNKGKKGIAVEIKMKEDDEYMEKVKITKENFFERSGFKVSNESKVFTESGEAVTSEPVLEIIRKAKHFIEQKDVDGFICLMYGKEARELNDDDICLLLSSRIVECEFIDVFRLIDKATDFYSAKPNFFSETTHQVMKDYDLYLEQKHSDE